MWITQQLLKSAACGHHMGNGGRDFGCFAGNSKCESDASQVVKQAIGWLTPSTKVPLYREKVQSINWLLCAGVSLSPLAVNPVVCLEWDDSEEACLNHFSTYQTRTISPLSDPPGSAPRRSSHNLPLLWLFYRFKFFMPHCCGTGPARAERRVGHTVHSHYSYLDGTPVWLCPGPSVGFCSSISAICAFLRRLWGPRRRQNDWHFSGTTRGTVPRAFSCQWCALTLTKPDRVEGGGCVGGWRQTGGLGRKQLHLQYCSNHVGASESSTCQSEKLFHDLHFSLTHSDGTGMN